MVCGPEIAAAPTFARPLPRGATPCAGRQGADAKHHGDDHLGLGRSQLFAQPGEMAAGQVAGFVRQHPDDLVRGLRLQQCAMVHENAMAVRDKRIEYRLVDDRDLDILLLQARDAKDRPRIVAQELLGLGVAQDPNLLLLGEGSHRRSKEGDRGGDRGYFGRFPKQGEAQQHQAVFTDWRRV